MKQSRLWSFIESFVQVGAGFVVAIIVQRVAFPYWDIWIGFKVAIEIALIFTVLSIARQFLIRRLFEWIRVGT